MYLCCLVKYCNLELFKHNENEIHNHDIYNIIYNAIEYNPNYDLIEYLLKTNYDKIYKLNTQFIINLHNGQNSEKLKNILWLIYTHPIYNIFQKVNVELTYYSDKYDDKKKYENFKVSKNKICNCSTLRIIGFGFDCINKSIYKTLVKFDKDLVHKILLYKTSYIKSYMCDDLYNLCIKYL